jgi:hypothetical protein
MHSSGFDDAATAPRGFGVADRYLNSTLAAEIAELFTEPSLRLVQNASHWPQ